MKSVFQRIDPKKPIETNVSPIETVLANFHTLLERLGGYGERYPAAQRLFIFR